MRKLYVASVSWGARYRLPGPPTAVRATAFAWAEGHLTLKRARLVVLRYRGDSGFAETRWTYDRARGRWRRTDLCAARGVQ